MTTTYEQVASLNVVTTTKPQIANVLKAFADWIAAFGNRKVSVKVEISIVKEDGVAQ